jgi:hypothetical protein
VSRRGAQGPARAAAARAFRGFAVASVSAELCARAYLVLHKFKVSAGAQVRILGQVAERILGCREAVHQHECKVGLVLRAHRANLLGDQVEEGVVAFDGQQRLGLVESHAGAEAAVELEHQRLLQERRVGLNVERVHVRERVDRRDAALGDHGRSARDEDAVVVLECGDRRLVQPLGRHLLLVGGPELVHRARHNLIYAADLSARWIRFSESTMIRSEVKVIMGRLNIIKLSGWLSGALLQVADDCRRLS